MDPNASRASFYSDEAVKVTEAHVSPMVAAGDKLLGFAEIQLDGEMFMKKLRLIRGSRGIFVSMPQEELRDRCPNPRCRGWNVLRATFCNWCGLKQPEKRGMMKCSGCSAFNRETEKECSNCKQSLENCSPKFYRDIVMLDSEGLKEEIEKKVVEEYRSVLEGGLK